MCGVIMGIGILAADIIWTFSHDQFVRLILVSIFVVVCNTKEAEQ